MGRNKVLSHNLYNQFPDEDGLPSYWSYIVQKKVMGAEWLRQSYHLSYYKT